MIDVKNIGMMTILVIVKVLGILNTPTIAPPLEQLKVISYTLSFYLLSFPLVGNPSFVRKDSGRAGMTNPIPRSSTTGSSFKEYLKVILGTSILIQDDYNMYYQYFHKVHQALFC